MESPPLSSTFGIIDEIKISRGIFDTDKEI